MSMLPCLKYWSHACLNIFLNFEGSLKKAVCKAAEVGGNVDSWIIVKPAGFCKTAGFSPEDDCEAILCNQTCFLHFN